MTLFFIFALLLIAVATALIVPPLWRGHRSAVAAADRKTANLAIFRDQLNELASEKAEGSLADSDFEQARSELQRRLLEDVEPADSDSLPASHAPSRKLAIALALALPLLGLLAYGQLGNPQALDPAQTVAQPKMTPDQIFAMVDQLAEKMKANPDDMKGWLMLGRSYKTLGRYPEAVAAYAKAETLIDQDPDLLATYAETVAMANDNVLAGKPLQLIEKALKLDPKHGHSLFLGGAAAMEVGDSKKAIAYWEALLPQVEPGSEIDQMLRGSIDKMKAGK